MDRAAPMPGEASLGKGGHWSGAAWRRAPVEFTDAMTLPNWAGLPRSPSDVNAKVPGAVTTANGCVAVFEPSEQLPDLPTRQRIPAPKESRGSHFSPRGPCQ